MDPRSTDKTGQGPVKSREKQYPAAVKECLLAEIRSSALRARLLVQDIDTIGVALKHGLIEVEDAVKALKDCGSWPLLVNLKIE